MTRDRRRILFGAASTLALAVSSRAATALDPNTKTFSDQQGLQAVNVAPPDLQMLLQAQQDATAVPSTVAGFTQYVSELAVVQAIKSGKNSDYNHFMAWHALILDLSALDHTTIAGTNDTSFAEQFGPHCTSRAFAIFHLALFEATNAIYRTHPSYRGLQARILAEAGVSASTTTPDTASVALAIAYAAKGILDVLYKKKSVFTTIVFDILVIFAPPATASARQRGMAIGRAAAEKVLEIRRYDPNTGAFNDGSRDVAGAQSLSAEPTYQTLQAEGVLPKSPTALDWKTDPIVPNQVALGGHWNQVTPFALNKIPMLPPFPAVGSAEFQATYVDVRDYGGDPKPPQTGSRFPTPTLRTGTEEGAPLDNSNQTFRSTFWGYDATALLCAPPRLYNMIATSVALNERPIARTNDMAYYLALVNLALGDAGIAAWANKYHHHLARPVTYIRGTNPTQVVRGVANAHWTPKGSPGSNGPVNRTNFTPPFPAYPSGHATFGGALFQIMRRFFNTQDTGLIPFKFVSDEYNGRNRDSSGKIRPYVQRTFPSLTFAEAECARSRIWDGVHWQVDGDRGTALGNTIADYVFDNCFQT